MLLDALDGVEETELPARAPPAFAAEPDFDAAEPLDFDPLVGVDFEKEAPLPGVTVFGVVTTGLGVGKPFEEAALGPPEEATEVPPSRYERVKEQRMGSMHSGEGGQEITTP